MKSFDAKFPMFRLANDGLWTGLWKGERKSEALAPYNEVAWLTCKVVPSGVPLKVVFRIVGSVPPFAGSRRKCCMFVTGKG